MPHKKRKPRARIHGIDGRRLGGLNWLVDVGEIVDHRTETVDYWIKRFVVINSTHKKALKSCCFAEPAGLKNF